MKNKALASLLALAVVSPAFGQATKGDAKAAEAKVAMCIGCHGIPKYQASFPEVHKVPMISGQGAGYLAAALAAYKKGDRRHPTMRGIAASLSEQDIADLAAYYAQHGRVEGAAVAEAPNAQAPSDVAKLLEKGACASCHGASFNKPVDPSYPKIAGQYADYLYVALKSYKTEHNAVVGRSNPIMQAQVKPFSNAELRQMANHLAALPGELKTVPQERFVAAAPR